MRFPTTCVLAALLATVSAAAERPPGVPAGLRKVGPIAGGWVLSNGRLLRPWGDQIELPGHLFSVVVSPDGKTGFPLVAANRFKEPIRFRGDADGGLLRGAAQQPSAV